MGRVVPGHHSVQRGASSLYIYGQLIYGPWICIKETLLIDTTSKAFLNYIHIHIQTYVCMK